MEGRYCRVEPVEPQRHAAELHDANMRDAEGRMWSYMPYGPFDSAAGYRSWMEETCLQDDPLFHAIIDNAMGKAAGLASYLRITPAAGAIEVDHIAYSLPLQRTRASTEAMYLMMQRVFDELWAIAAMNGNAMRSTPLRGMRLCVWASNSRVSSGRRRSTRAAIVTRPGFRSRTRSGRR